MHLNLTLHPYDVGLEPSSGEGRSSVECCGRDHEYHFYLGSHSKKYKQAIYMTVVIICLWDPQGQFMIS